MSGVFYSFAALAVLVVGIAALPARVVARLDGSGWWRQPSTRIGAWAAAAAVAAAAFAKWAEDLGWLSSERVWSVHNAASWAASMVGAGALAIGARCVVRRTLPRSSARRLARAACATAVVATVGLLAPTWNGVVGLVDAGPGWWIPLDRGYAALFVALAAASTSLALIGLAAARAGIVGRRGVRLPFWVGVSAACAAAAIDLVLVGAVVCEIVADPVWSMRAGTLLSVGIIVGLVLVFVAVALLAAAIEFSPTRWTRVDVAGSVVMLVGSIFPPYDGFGALAYGDQTAVRIGQTAVVLVVAVGAMVLCGAWLYMCRDRALVRFVGEFRNDAKLSSDVESSVGWRSMRRGIGGCVRRGLASRAGKLTDAGWRVVHAVDVELALFARDLPARTSDGDDAAEA